MKKLIATDFDGTLYILGKIPTSNRRNIALWRKAGGLFGVVTGRGIDFVSTIKKHGIEYDYLILYNGALILDNKGNVLFESFINDEIFSEIADIFRDRAGVEYFDEPDGTPRHQFYATCDNPQTALVFAEEINNCYPDEVNAVVNGEHVNIGAKGSTKATGVARVLEYFGLGEDEAAVVGDDYNDLEMITVHKGWAVATGRREVRRAASGICYSVGSLAKRLTAELTE